MELACDLDTINFTLTSCTECVRDNWHVKKVELYNLLTNKARKTEVLIL